MSAELQALADKIIADSKPFGFVLDDDCFWASETGLVHYVAPTGMNDIWDLLHEIAHAQLGHQDYDRDIELLRNEAAAWELAIIQLAPRFELTIDRDYAEEQLIRTVTGWQPEAVALIVARPDSKPLAATSA